MCWLQALEPNQQTGSFPRCLRLLEGDRTAIAARLQSLVGLAEVQITETHFWMPLGPPTPMLNGNWDINPTREPKLGEDDGFLTPQERSRITDWWLSVSRNANTPNWDVASTATIQGKRGFLLVEAKAHNVELRKAQAGKPLGTRVTPNSRRNHVRIGACIQEASLALTGATRRPWALSRDWNYQMSNRFAWSWKLTEMGYPVVLVYLGFLGAEEMRDGNQVPFDNAVEWTAAINDHSATLIPGEIWNTQLTIGRVAFSPLIRTMDCPLEEAIAEVVP